MGWHEQIQIDTNVTQTNKLNKMATTQITFTTDQLAFLGQWFNQQKNAYVGAVMEDEFPADEESFQNLCDATFNVSGFKVGEMAVRVTGDTPTGGRKKKEKKEKDPNAPKRGKTPYMNWLWSSEGMEKVKSENPDLTHKAAMSKAAEVWKGMDGGAKEPWEKMSGDQKEAYEKAMKDYVAPEGSVVKKEKKVSGKKEVKMDGHGELEGFEGPKGNMFLKGYADKKKYGTLEEAGEAFSSVENAGGIVYDGKHYTIRKKGVAQECSQANIL